MIALLQGCTASEDLQVEVTIDEQMGSIATLTWETAVDSLCTVTVQPTGEPERNETEAGDASTSHELVLIGLIAEWDHDFEVVCRQGDQEVGQGTGSFTTEAPPAALPRWTVWESEPAERGFLAFTIARQHDLFTAVMDLEGRYVWWFTEDLLDRAISRALVSRDGSSILYGIYPVTNTDDMTRGIHRVPLAGRTSEYFDLEGYHHDFVEHDDGTVVYLANDTREIEGHIVLGDQLVELRPDGSSQQVWSVWDTDLWPDLPDSQIDWTHANALDYDALGDRYLVSLHLLDAILAIDRSTGAVEWYLGGPLNDFVMQGNGTWTSYQHQFDLSGNQLLVFDNGDVEAMSSRVVQFSLDTDEWRVEQTWEYAMDPPRYNPAMGDVRRMDSGNSLITWSLLGEIDEVTPGGEVVRKLNTEAGAILGYTTWLDEFPPTAP